VDTSPDAGRSSTTMLCGLGETCRSHGCHNWWGGRTHCPTETCTFSPSRLVAGLGRRPPRHDGHAPRSCTKQSLCVRWRNGLQTLDDVCTPDAGGWLGRIISEHNSLSATRVSWRIWSEHEMIVVRGRDVREYFSSRTYGVSASVRPFACPDPHFKLNAKERFNHTLFES
jgi:hypothetical protein